MYCMNLLIEYFIWFFFFILFKVFVFFYLDGDFNNYLIYFWRVIVFLVMGKLKFVLFDLIKVIELKLDFIVVSFK